MMCGRYSQIQKQQELCSAFAIEEAAEILPRYNIAPSQLAPVILEADGTRVLDLYKWGLIPSWAKDLKMAYKMINARCETVTEKPAYRRLVNRRRCIVPASSIYEWKKAGDGQKTAMRILMKDESLFAMAGLWDEWKDAEGQPLRSYTILTTRAKGLLKEVHDRMPVILRPNLIDAWLDPGVKLGEVAEVFESSMAQEMDYYPVSQVVNSARNDGPECWQRVGA